jgi:hypothetical protein
MIVDIATAHFQECPKLSLKCWGIRTLIGTDANSRIVAYKQQMPTVRQTETFSAWLNDLRDARAFSKIVVRASGAWPTVTQATSPPSAMA